MLIVLQYFLEKRQRGRENKIICDINIKKRLRP